MKNIYFHNLGCDKNTVNGEVLLGNLVENGFAVTQDPNKSDLIIINTCCFIDAAKEESIDAILTFVNQDFEKDPKIVVTGCMVERYKTELEEEIPEVDLFSVFNKPEDIIHLFFDTEVNKGQRLLNNKPYSYLKISEGCDRNCTYCAIPNIKGRHRSFNIDEILAEAKRLNDNGVKELILIAQDITQYGKDLGKENLKLLLKKLSENFDFEWIRLLYVYPEGIDEELLNLIKESKNILPYFDMPIQHTNNRILKRMGRHITKEEIYKKVEMIRRILPDAVLRSTVIVGFPSETDEEFEELLTDLNNLKFDRLGAFKYSREEGTPAYDFEGQIDDETKEERINKVDQLQNKVMMERNKRFIGSIFPVIIEEEIDSQTYGGRIYADAPEIDNQTYIYSPRSLNIGDIEQVKLLSSLDYEFTGDLYESTK